MVVGHARANGQKVEQPMDAAAVAAVGEWLNTPPIWERANG
jgi:hypothetical protein